MRILFTPMASPTQVRAIVPLAWACRARGHDVRVAAQPSAVDTIAGCGLPAVAVGDSSRAGIASDAAVAPDLVAFGQWWRPHLIVTDPMVHAGPLAADVLGVPLVRHLVGPVWTGTGYGMHARGVEPPPWPDALVALFESYGARPQVDHAIGTIDAFPPSLQQPGLARRITMRAVPHAGSAGLPAWLREAPTRPRLALAAADGSGDEGFPLALILAGVAKLDLDVVIAIAGRDHRLGELPSNARVAPDLPLDLVLPSCSGLVGPGDAGSTLAAAVAGVPQVVVPLRGDQPATAGLLAGAGVAITLDAPGLDPTTVADAVQEAVFGTALRYAAENVQAEIQTLPLPATIATHLETLAAPL